MHRLEELIGRAEKRGRTLDAGTVVLADQLTSSSGRFQRTWYAPPGGVWLALAWPDILLPEFSRLLPFAVGLACCRSIRTHGVDCRLKWVNDLLVDGRKIGGILCRTVLSPGGEQWHLLGLGINCNNQGFPRELDPPATCLARESGEVVDLSRFTGRLLAELHWSLGLLHHDEEQALAEQKTCDDGRFPLLLRAWQDLCDTLGRRVEYGFDVQQKPLYQALARAIDPCGGLVMELGDGAEVVEYSGEIRYL